MTDISKCLSAVDKAEAMKFMIIDDDIDFTGTNEFTVCL